MRLTLRVQASLELRATHRSLVILGLKASSPRRPQTVGVGLASAETRTSTLSPSTNARAFYPRMFTATPSTGSLNTP